MIRGRQSGQAMVEFAIILPLLLFILTGVVQLALMYTAREMVSYASFVAARAALVADHLALESDIYPSVEEAREEEAQKAAALVMSPVSIGGTTLAGPTGDVTNLPGWGNLPNSRRADERVAISIIDEPTPASDRVTVEVEYKFQLIFPPFALQMLGVAGPWGDIETINGGHFVTMTDTTTLAKKILQETP